jgi:hypothetical protein
MFKKLRWTIIIPGIFSSLTQASLVAPSVEDPYVQKDIFILHLPPQDSAQKDFQSDDYKVSYLANPAPDKEEQDFLIASGRILSNRDWFLRKMEKTPPEDPALSWIRKRWLVSHNFKETEIDKYKPEADYVQKQIAAQKARLKKAAKGYNTLIANLAEKRGIPKPGSVVAETPDNCQKTAAAPADSAKPAPDHFLTLAPEAVAKLSNDYFKIAGTQINQDTTAESQRQVQAAKKDPSYVVQTVVPFSTARLPADTPVAPQRTAQVDTALPACGTDPDCVHLDNPDSLKAVSVSDSRLQIVGTTPRPNLPVMITVHKLNADGSVQQGIVAIKTGSSDAQGKIDLPAYLPYGASKYQIGVSYNPGSTSGATQTTIASFVAENKDAADKSFMFPSDSVQSDAPEVIALSKKIISDANAQTDADRVKAIHDWVKNNISYDQSFLTNGSPTALDSLSVIKAGTGICYGYSELFAALARASGIPTKMVNGTVVDSAGKQWPSHEWNEVQVDGHWQNVDTTWDRAFGTKYLYITPDMFSKDHQKVSESIL